MESLGIAVTLAACVYVAYKVASSSGHLSEASAGLAGVCAGIAGFALIYWAFFA